ncbi:MAG TPA: hypothetical protein VMW81_06645 [Nitrospinota bacterium]|nr:hypothetical protein [Nitrospinota bacterium]
MQKIPLDMAKSGMKLAKDVLTDNGRVLCGQGTELTDSLLLRLDNLGIESITVEGFPVPMPGEEVKPLEVLIEELEERFKMVTSEPLLMEIKEILKKQLIFKEEERKAYLEKSESETFEDNKL